MLSRRRLVQALAVSGVAAWVWAAPRLPQLFGPDLTFSAIGNAPPFRRLTTTGAASALNAVLAGLDDSPPRAISVCAHLYDGAPTGIAIFSDANCPNCPEMDRRVRRAAAGTGLPLVHHMLPILGPSSELAARAYIAALAQPGSDAFRNALMDTPAIPTPRLIKGLAADHRLDPAQLAVDMDSAATRRRLDADRALADHLGLIGTPATVIGRTVMLGNLPLGTIRQIITLEQEMEPPCA